MNPDLQILISLQEIDLKIVNIQKQISEVPAKIQFQQSELEQITRQHQERVSLSQDLSKRRRSSEGEVDMMRSKLAKLKDQLMSVKTNKEYTAMQHEIQMAEEQIRAKEDEILEMMEQMETTEKELRESEKDLSSRISGLQTSIRMLEESIPRSESEVVRLQSEKLLMEQRVEVDLLARYRQLADRRKGLAIAEAKDELCSACHVRIRPQVYALLRKNEIIQSCDSCDRILYHREAF